MEYLSDGITESLIADLSQIPKLRVLAPATIFKYKGRQIDPRTVGQELHVSAVLQGSVTKFGDALRIAVDLVNSADETELWGEHYNPKLADILPVEEDISREIVGKLRLRLNREETERLAKFSTEDPEAYQLYLKGRYYWNKRSEERVREAIRYFEEAIAKDPTYARAYAGLADSYIILGSYEFVAPNDAYPKAKAAAQRALELDDTVAEAHTSLAWVRSVYDWDSHEAEKQFKRALELNPNYATAHHWYGLFLTNGARFEEAMREMNRAQDLDPLSLIITTQAGEPFYLSRRFGRAIEQYRKALEMDANFWPAHQFLGLAYEGTGQLSSAISELQNALELSGGNTQLMAAIGHTFAVSGNTTEANRILNQLRELSTRRFVSTYGVALIYVGLKENDQAFQWLERSREEKSLLDDHDITTDSRLDELRRDPRFAQLLRSVGLAE